MKVTTKYELGDKVGLISDETNAMRVITSILIKSKNHHEYNLSYGLEASWHTEHEFELWKEREKQSAGFKKKNDA